MALLGREGGVVQANKGQVTAILSQISLHTHPHTYSIAEEHKRTHTEGEIACLPPKWRGMSRPQGIVYNYNNLKSSGRQLTHLGRNLIGCVIFDSFLSSQSHQQLNI